jgi:two-component system sensor histidine kinase ChiS
MIPKVLIVDDEVDLEELLMQKFRRKLRKEEIELFFAHNGLEALEKISENPDIDIVITDINMPEMDGLSLLGKLNENHPLIKAIVLSAYGDMDNIRVAMNRGAFDFLNKPLNFEDLEITIEKTLNFVNKLKENESLRTETLKAQKEAMNAQGELLLTLQKMDKLKDEFLANTSHELRTPLNGIIGIAESMVEGATGSISKQQDFNLQMIIASGKRLFNLVNDILDFSKLKHKNIELERRPVDIRAITDIVFTVLKPTIKNKTLNLINNIDTDFTLINVDEDRIQQIMYNLVGNGIKFTESGSVEVSAEHTENSVFIRITDTGMGIPEDQLESIFEPFEQGDGSVERKYGGTGIGLTITRQLVELHNGKIFVKSDPGGGSTFTLKLPYEIIPGNRDDYINPQVILENDITTTSLTDDEPEFVRYNNEEFTKDNFNILIVDDEPINLQVLQNQLSMENYSITQAESGMQALEFINSDNKFDLVLLDIMMPKMSGYEVCLKIREKFPASRLPIVMLTAKNRVSDLVEGFNLGANDYLTKPFTKKELMARIKSHIELSKINFALNRFVPHELIRFLGHDSIVNVKLGDQIQKDLTVMFSDIRSFTTLSETMSPFDNFKFINSYLSRVSPLIRKNNGFIDKYIGDAIMALFPRKIEDSLIAAIEMIKEVGNYNIFRHTQGYKPISIGIGLHTGSLMLGTIGENERMEGTVISDAVNLTSRLEGLTKPYGVSIIVSEQVLAGIENVENYKYRFLDTVKVKGKNNSVSIFEVFDADPPELIDLKIKTLDDLKMAVELYQSKRFSEANECFLKILEINSQDTVANLYLKRCEKLLKYGIPEEWTGIESMEK